MVENLSKEVNFQVGMFQTRWSTHGAKTTANAHPHASQNGQFHVIHNGVITNHNEIKKRLREKGYKFASQTDTEVVPMLMQDCMTATGDTFEAWNMVVRELEGTWALIMVDVKQPNKMYVTKHGSPLLFCRSEDESIMGFASEMSGFDFAVRTYIDIPDGDIIECGIDSEKGEWIMSSKNLSMDLNKSTFESKQPHEKLPQSPAPFKYWTEKEIHAQPETIWNALNCGGRLYHDNDEWHVKLGGLEKWLVPLQRVKHLIMVGCGTSLHAAQFALPLFREFGIFTTVQCLDAAEFSVDDLPLQEATAVVIISQSGETKDCHRVLQLIRNRCVTIGVVNAVGSLISRDTDCGVYLNSGREVGVAATKSFTSQCVVLSLLALWFAQGRGKSINRRALQLFSLTTRVRDQMIFLTQFVQEILSKKVLLRQEHLFILGRGFSFAIALEGALKIKELAYVHAEGFAGGSLKHGPFAMIDSEEKTPVFLHIWSDVTQSHMISCAEQLSARGAQLIILTNIKSIALDFPNALVWCVAVEDDFSASLLSVVLYQLLAVYLALEKQVNPDFPRNLAKTISID